MGVRRYNESYIGKRYGRLVVVGFSYPHGKAVLSCRCDCGVVREFSAFNVTRKSNRGRAKSCGCYRVDIATKHGQSGQRSRSYKIWCGMIQRCYDKNSTPFLDYGGRGIETDPAWRDFQNFYADMGDAPDGLTLDRIDNNKGYSKQNCRWATRIEQSRNKRTNRVVSIFGETGCVSYFAEKYGILATTLLWRLNRGLKDQELLTRKRSKCIL